MREYQWYYSQGGQQIGPVSQMELMALLRTGQVKTDDLVWTDGMADWIPAHVMVELWDRTPTGAIPLERAEPRASGLAITSMVCGILGLCCCVTAIPAVVCGHIALSQINREPALYRGRGMALAGLVLGYISIALNIIGLIYSLLTGNAMPFSPLITS